MKRIAVGVLMLGFIVAAPAQSEQRGHAKASNKSCPDGAVCLWTGKHYKGKRLVLKKAADDPASNRIAHVMDDKVSSAKNRYEFIAWLYEDVNGGGQAFCIFAGQNIPDYAAFGDEFNNDASSSWLPTGPTLCNA